MRVLRVGARREEEGPGEVLEVFQLRPGQIREFEMTRKAEYKILGVYSASEGGEGSVEAVHK